MTEQTSPRDLIGHAVATERAGFDFAVSSDHYFPWLDEMGHSPNAWVTLGAFAPATSTIGLMTYVTAPTFRYHPTVVAQEAATLQIISGGRFTLGLGSGEVAPSSVPSRKVAQLPISWGADVEAATERAHPFPLGHGWLEGERRTAQHRGLRGRLQPCPTRGRRGTDPVRQ